MTVQDDWEWTGYDGFGQVRTGYDGSKGRWYGRLNTKGRVETDQTKVGTGWDDW